MSTEQLTTGTCARLNNPANHTVLVSSPVLKVVRISPADEQLSGFVVNRVATVTDGEATSQVALPDTLRVWASGTGLPTLNPNDVIKVQKMLRLPHGDTSVILVHDVEICSEENDELVVTDCDVQIRSLQEELAKTKTALKRVLQEQYGIGPTLVESVMQLVKSVNDPIEEAIA
ncbi:hypothetical protein C8T65DRAFT_738031 [Cerioporus squamosus]|nr:hypothetical protein C8T65DRAFT_738031 [Cerioporus squamosus]